MGVGNSGREALRGRKTLGVGLGCGEVKRGCWVRGRPAEYGGEGVGEKDQGERSWAVYNDCCHHWWQAPAKVIARAKGLLWAGSPRGQRGRNSRGLSPPLRLRCCSCCWMVMSFPRPCGSGAELRSSFW